MNKINEVMDKLEQEKVRYCKNHNMTIEEYNERQLKRKYTKEIKDLLEDYANVKTEIKSVVISEHIHSKTRVIKFEILINHLSSVILSSLINNINYELYEIEPYSQDQLLLTMFKVIDYEQN